MQNLEAEFGVRLFIRSKNRIELNENGQLAVTYARALLDDALREDICDLAILPFKVPHADFTQAEYAEEHLSITVKKEHPLSAESQVTFSDLNGYNFLIRSDIGFWEKLCRDKMPSSKFPVQNSDSDLRELINNSTLPSFITDLASSQAILSAYRIAIPVTDSEANITYYISSKHPEKFERFFG